MPVPDESVRSDLPDVAHLSLTELRELHDEALNAGLERVIRRVRTADERLSGGSRRFD
ncbi:hypothetical protein I6A84_05990 [Frankia sp. CNm7]|uniref:Uncharacterized protein n=1 Tax=Frankia nepalensis TaxID=1836974 RepID=A0A937RM63_9ACTN|nr:hypothetical protein [Frankia nepalensis]MBL7497790.1 hypothetical protein [Frankia nepalensis]MBL7511293.1 hypothetical protein [Frankia nepalensis]MBL7517686.1 hypothetical protein [Frankia nepalensis]MBL7629859.1 hypothetical protein [Frankia nepalensis]